MDDFMKYHCKKSPEWLWSLHEAGIRQRLDALDSECSDCLSGLEPTIAPQSKQCVRTTATFTQFAIELVPVTTSIAIIKPSTKLTPGQIPLDETWKHPHTKDVYTIVLNKSGGLKLPP